MGSFDIYDDTSPNALYREMTQKRKFYRGSEVSYDQPPAYTALEYSPGMTEEEQAILIRSPRGLIPPQRGPMPINTSSFLRRETYRSGFPNRSEFSGLGSSQSDQARAAAKKVGGNRGLVLSKLAAWSDSFDKYSEVLDRMASNLSEIYVTGYLTCTLAQTYNENAMYVWTVMSNLVDGLRGIDPAVAGLLHEVPTPLLFAHSTKVTYRSDGRISTILPVLRCNADGLVDPGASFQTPPNYQTVSDSSGSSDYPAELGSWWWIAGIVLGGLMTALIIHTLGDDIVKPIADALSGVDHKRIELDQQLLNAKAADKRVAWIKVCIYDNAKAGLTPDQRMKVAKSCEDQATRLYPYGKLSSSMSLFTKLLLAAGIGTAGYLAWRWWQKRQENN